MSEIAKYDAYKQKLQGICDENDLVFRFRNDTYPITLTIRPVDGIEAQMCLMECVEDKGYTSPDASIVFAFKDGALTYRMSDTFTISDALFSKIKNLFKNLHYCWLQFFFRDLIERQVLTESTMPYAGDDELPVDAFLDDDPLDEDTPDEDDPLQGYEYAGVQTLAAQMQNREGDTP